MTYNDTITGWGAAEHRYMLIMALMTLLLLVVLALLAEFSMKETEKALDEVRALRRELQLSRMASGDREVARDKTTRKANGEAAERLRRSLSSATGKAHGEGAWGGAASLRRSPSRAVGEEDEEAAAWLRRSMSSAMGKAN